MSTTRALGLRLMLSRGGNPRSRYRQIGTSSVCLFCSLSRLYYAPATTFKGTPQAQAAALYRSRKNSPSSSALRRYQSTDSSSPTEPTSSSPQPDEDPRNDLQRALLELQTHAANYVNLSRLQLALLNLKQQPGRESVRVAFLGITNGSSELQPGSSAKHLLRLVLADPLQPAADWESRLEGHDVSQRPLIVRVGPAASDSPEEGIRSDKLETARDHMIPEMKIPSPKLNDANLEMLLMEADTLGLAQLSEPNTFEDAVLVPTVDIASPSSTHPVPITTPVHMALLVGDGVLGAASILSLPILEGRDTITAAVNFNQLGGSEDLSSCPFIGLNIDAANQGLDLFRANVGNAMKYESLWTESNVGRVDEWLSANVLPPSRDDGSAVKTKVPVRELIQSLLQNASATIRAEEARQLSQSLTANVSPARSVARLDQALAEWSQNAHEELQQQLEAAFSSRPWRKMNWWKLFWRVDDVGMLSSDMLALRFLPDAEKRIIHLAGRVQEAIIITHNDAPINGQSSSLYFSGPVLLPSPDATSVVTSPKKRNAVVPEQPTTTAATAMWPTHIPFTRTYLQEKTVPALQALAQKLVLQSVTTMALTSALGVLSYLSALGAYESGAIAALGLVWSLRRLQTKWESARDFWEGEVREEGRKAVRACEASVAEVLDRAQKQQERDDRPLTEELRRASEIIERAEDALARMK
ncbi:hypothetical protein B0H66DRAFT_129409 [Apodospora peruviana]|uniref:Mmc1 C-terminal domain-containing protein n=1 Tax=Apodospora peruviana TaxID=516989 RepID=A0AAE0IIA5_9PEZI|nr:hypothetical protein B0H66DRAFT_129409 [Apodospora peruviana]